MKLILFNKTVIFMKTKNHMPQDKTIMLTLTTKIRLTL